MKLSSRNSQWWAWRATAAILFAAGAAPAYAGDWGNWPVPWPPAGSTNPPAEGPPAGSSLPPPTETPPPAGGGVPPVIEVPPPGGGGPPVGAESPPGVPIPTTPTGPSSPEPASAVMGLCGLGAGLLAWRRKRSR